MFYKKKYLLALYDNNDKNLGVYENVEEFFKIRKIKRKHYFYEKICKSDCKEIKFKNCYLCFIDVDEINDDIFKEEDKLFKKEFCDKFLNNRELCKKYNINERTFYRHKKIKQLKKEGKFYNELQRKIFNVL